MNTKDIKILGVMIEEPFDYRTWSGSSSYFFTALKRAGCLYDAISAQPSKAIEYLYKLYSFNAGIKKWKFKFNINIDYYKARTKTALHKIASIGENKYNVILQIGAWYDITKIKNKLTVSYHDGTLQTFLQGPFGYPRIKENYIKRTMDYEKKLYEKIDFIFTMSKWLAGSFIKDFGIDQSKIEAVGAGINLPYINEIKNKSYEEPNILFIGREFERKGGRYLLEAFEIVKKEIKDVTLTIIGKDIKNAPPGVRCLSQISKENKDELNILLKEYSDASIFVMPSLYECFGIVFLEAMAHKLPCIGTNICAMPEIIDNGVNGYTVPPKDTKSLAKHIIDILKDPKTCKKMGENAYDKYIKNYRWDIVAKRITDRLEKII